MIKSALEARELISGGWGYGAYNGKTTEVQFEFAKGYLAALEGPEVKALVETCEKVIFECFRESEAGAVEELEIALSQYHEAVK